MLANSLVPYSRGALLHRLGLRAKAERLSQALTRRKLAERADVTESAIKRFETTGEIGVSTMLALMLALGISEQFDALFRADLPKTFAQLQPGTLRQRGRRSDHGKTRAKKPDNG
jgi:transcriptional regulator with XRE-family HTH domain